MACEHTEKWEERWKPFYKENKNITKVFGHRNLPNGDEIFKFKMVDGTCEVRVFKKKGVKASEAVEAYNNYKDTFDGLSPIGVAKGKDKPVKKAAKPAKKAAAKKEVKKAPTKKASKAKAPAEKAVPKKTAAKKTPAEKAPAKKKARPKSKTDKGIDPFFA